MREKDGDNFDLIGLVFTGLLAIVIAGAVIILIGNSEPGYGIGRCVANGDEIYQFTFKFDHGYELKKMGTKDEKIYRTFKQLDDHWNRVDCTSVLYTDRS